ncbi:MAG: hypothetical protein RSA06_03095 [Erysipelotrichaceae bacterium]
MSILEVRKLSALLKNESRKGTIQEADYWPKLWNDYIGEKSCEYALLDNAEVLGKMISEQNYRERAKLYSCSELGIEIKIGDICFIDFGEAYINESGYQHFGIVMSIMNGKALVIPMSSNYHTYKQALSEDNPLGKAHLMQIGLIKGLVKKSVLFLNDAKFINTARMIEVKAHINEEDEIFKEIKLRFKNCID